MFRRKLVGKLNYLQIFNYYLQKCSEGKLLIYCSDIMLGQHLKYDDVCVQQPHVVEVLRHKNVDESCMSCS